MQSGLKNTNRWCLSNCEINETFISSKFCWNGSSNPKKRVRLFFKTLDEAKKICLLKRNFLFEIVLPAKRKILKKSYSQNFIKKKNV